MIVVNKMVCHYRGYLRILLVGCVFFLAGCQSDHNADTGNIDADNSGIGGTGITRGAISGFGSVIVNGIEFNTENATFTRDSLPANEQDFLLGDVVSIDATYDVSGKFAMANSMSYRDMLEGPVGSTPGNNTFEMLGQEIVVDSATTFANFNRLNELKTHNFLEISGYHGSDGKVYATRVELKADTYVPGMILELKGRVAAVDTARKTFNIEGLTVDYANAQLDHIPNGVPVAGDYVEITSHRNFDGEILLAEIIVSTSETLPLTPGSGANIEGLVTRIDSPSAFNINGLDVAVTATSSFFNGTAEDLNLNTKVQVIGTTDDQGVLLAEEVHLLRIGEECIKATLEPNPVDLESQRLEILGVDVKTGPRTVFQDKSDRQQINLSLSDLSEGEFLRVCGDVDADNALLALRIERHNPYPHTRVKGFTTEQDAVLRVFKMLDILFSTSSETVYQDFNGKEISAAVFFNRLAADHALVTAKGDLIGNSPYEIRASQLKLEP